MRQKKTAHIQATSDLTGDAKIRDTYEEQLWQTSCPSSGEVKEGPAD